MATRSASCRATTGAWGAGRARWVAAGWSATAGLLHGLPGAEQSHHPLSTLYLHVAKGMGVLAIHGPPK